MKIYFSALFFLLFIFSLSAKAHPPSTLTIRCQGSTDSHCARSGLLNESRIETLGADQYLVLSSSPTQSRCAISKASAAKQGVTIEFLNEMANRYQVEVTCLYIFPLRPGQVEANEFAFRASMR
jgi:hypothetical protein